MTGDSRTVCIPLPVWQGLEMVAKLSHTSISEELRRGAVARLERYGLSIVDGELSINPLLWPTPEIQRGGEIQGGGEIQQGGEIQGGGALASPDKSTREETA